MPTTGNFFPGGGLGLNNETRLLFSPGAGLWCRAGFCLLVATESASCSCPSPDGELPGASSMSSGGRPHVRVVLSGALAVGKAG